MFFDTPFIIQYICYTRSEGRCGQRMPEMPNREPPGSKYCMECATPLPGSEDASFTKTLEAPTEELTRGSVFAGRYEIIELLGKGGMGRVYRAEDSKIREEVALKLIKSEISSDKKTIERFSNELKLARKIVYKNVGLELNPGKLFFGAISFFPACPENRLTA
jgi:hypothetical protein